MVTKQDLTQAIPAIEEEALPTCQHHWVIEPANGRISRGECQVCHEVKEFHNSIGDLERE